MVRKVKLLSAKEAKEIDIEAKSRLGISTLVLMETAGRHVSEQALEILGKRSSVGIFCGITRTYRTLAYRTAKCAPAGWMVRCAVFCGKGNNGGDGFVAARHLLAKGIKPAVFLAGNISDVKNEAKINLEILLRAKQKVIEVKQGNLYLLKKKISQYELIIDALLGVGLQCEVRGIYRDLIEMINKSKSYVLSVDIPSGLDATTGKVLGSCVKANKTVTLVAKKRGMVLGEGAKYCGRVVVKDLGIPL